eukprot:179659_1
MRPNSTAFSADKLLLAVGQKAMALQYGTMTECNIKQVMLCGFTSEPSFEDCIEVEFINTGYIKIFNRYQLECNPLYLKNRDKLSPGCSIEVEYKPGKWIASYIDNWALFPNNTRCTNMHIFSIQGTNYSRWSNKIRCCTDLLKLNKNSNVFVFDTEIELWCFGKIVDVIETANNRNIYHQPQLDVFQVNYRKHGKTYLKYVHQMSASVALVNTSMYRDCILSTSKAALSHADWIYYKLILQKFTEQTFNEEILAILIEYVGCLYGLVMYCENKTYGATLSKRNLNLTPKKTSIHFGLISMSNLRATAVPFTPNVKMKNKPISKLCAIIEGNESTLCPIKDSVFKPSKIRQTNERKLRVQLHRNNPYKSTYLKRVQGLIHIGRLIDVVLIRIKEDISDLFYYMLNIHAIQFDQFQNDNIKVFNYNFHDKHTDEILYGVALKCNSRGYKWRMIDKLFSPADIVSHNRWHLTKSCLPQFRNTLLNNDKIKSIIQWKLRDQKTFEQILTDTKWCKIKVYHGIIDNNNQIVWKLTQEQFKQHIAQFYMHHINDNNA